MRFGKSQFGAWLLGFAVGVAVPAGIWAQQRAHPDRPPQPAPRAQAHPAQPHAAQRHPANNNNNHPNANANRAPQNTPQPPRNTPNNQNGGNSNPGGNNPNGVRNGTSANYAPRQNLGIGAPKPWVDQMRDLSPADRERVLQNSKAFQNLSPDKQSKIRQQFGQWDRMTPTQRTDLRDKENTWRNLTPQQRDHIKNDVLPKWRQMPWDRQQVIKQKLGVLQNMPESARNQRLSDPNFTKGMSDEEKGTLQDLSHLHVGAPDPPGE